MLSKPSGGCVSFASHPCSYKVDILPPAPSESQLPLLSYLGPAKNRQPGDRGGDFTSMALRFSMVFLIPLLFKHAIEQGSVIARGPRRHYLGSRYFAPLGRDQTHHTIP